MNGQHHHDHGTMKAVKLDGTPFGVSVETLPIPKILQQTDAIIRPTSSAICGSDLHMYHGRYKTLTVTPGHEVVGIVEEVGNLVHDLKKGDRVIIFGLLSKTTNVGESVDIGILGFPAVEGQIEGGQAEYVRIPFASDNCFVLPPGKEHELDYVALADIFSTANWALDAAGFVYGESVAIFGAGPLGLLCVYSALLRGASKVYSIDRIPQRLAKAKELGAIPIDFTKEDPVAQILKYEPNGVDRSCDCVGYECIDSEGKNPGNTVIIQAIDVTRIKGGIGLIGGFVTEDAGGSTPDQKKGILPVPLGKLFEKSQTIGGGSVTREYIRNLFPLIQSGKAKPGFIFDTEIKIGSAVEAYKEFSNRKLIKAVIRF